MIENVTSVLLPMSTSSSSKFKVVILQKKGGETLLENQDSAFAIVQSRQKFWKSTKHWRQTTEIFRTFAKENRFEKNDL